MTHAQNDQPLNEDELDALSDYLASDRVPDTTLSLEGVDGLMCALWIGGAPLESAAWLPVIWGDELESEAFRPDAADRPMLDLLLRHWNSIGAAFERARRDPDDGYWPIMYLPDESTPDDATDTEYGRDWAVGFRLGMDFHSGFWDGVVQDEKLSGGLVPVVLLDLGMNPDEPDRVIDYGTRQDLVSDLIPMLHRYWLLAREGAVVEH